MKLAGMIAFMFHIDPIVVLDADRFDWEIRLAAANHVRAAQEKQQREAKHKR